LRLTSASFGGLKDWENAAKDAKECIKINPTFLKGFYRLATAQIELGELDGAMATIKSGLSVDPDNSQLHKQLRIVKAKKNPTKVGAHSAAAAGGGAMPGGLAGASTDPTANKELMDLRMQYIQTKKDFGTTQAEANKLQREIKVSELTRSELESLPESSDAKMYQGIGKMFLLSSREAVFDSLDKTIKDSQSKEADCSKKISYLENRLKSQEQNIRELLSGAS
jgi:chaperonin cofactor prefoldin